MGRLLKAIVLGVFMGPWRLGTPGDCRLAPLGLPGHPVPTCTSLVIHGGQGLRVSAFTLSTAPLGHGLWLPWRHPRMLASMAPSSKSLSKAGTPMALTVSH